jgi:quinohemoprotein ethanol dehydrogenase
MRKTLFGTLAALLALAAGSSGVAQQGAAAIGAGADWTAPGGAADEAGFSRLTQLTPGTVRNLGLAFAMDLPEEVTLQSTPLAIGGALYFSGGYAEVYAVDARSGQLKWKFDPETWKRRPDKMHFGANRGIAFEDGRPTHPITIRPARRGR